MITTTREIYEFVEMVIERCHEHGHDNIAQKFDEAMHLGSSGLEILGAIKTVCIAEKPNLENFLDGDKLDEIIRYVNRAFGAE